MNFFLITCSAGYIGSHYVVSLLQNNYKIIIFDNFSNSHQGVVSKLEKIVNKMNFFVKYYKKNLFK
jgi:UDP-glucose 4-epimerase